MKKWEFSRLTHSVCVKSVDLLAPILPDRLFIKLKFRLYMGYWPNLKNPVTFSEKLQWLKFDSLKHPEYSVMVDKATAKQYVSQIIGDKYIIPTIGVWNTVDEIDWEHLPNQFVIKATGDSGGIVVCKDKSKLDIAAASQKLKRLGSREYWRTSKEFPYRNVPHRYIAEEYKEDSKTKELRDYKFFCMDGVVKALFVASDRQKKGVDTKFDFFDPDFNHLDFRNGHPNAESCPEKPASFDEMKSIACALSKEFPHIRVDLYDVDGKVYFGELTFFHWSGMMPFEPKEWDTIFGDWITLPY